MTQFSESETKGFRHLVETLEDNMAFAGGGCQDGDIEIHNFPGDIISGSNGAVPAALPFLPANDADDFFPIMFIDPVANGDTDHMIGEIIHPLKIFMTVRRKNGM